MTYKIIFSVLILLSAFGSVFDIGKERKILTAGTVFVSIILSCLLVLSLWIFI
jgi:hypothetical protein